MPSVFADIVRRTSGLARRKIQMDTLREDDDADFYAN